MSFTDTWASAPVEETPDSTLPPEPGIYTVEIRDAKALTSKKGDDWVIVELRGLDGKATGHEWPLLQGFKSPEQAGFTKRVCRDLGVDVAKVTSLEDLDQALKQAVGRYFTVEVKRNGEYVNTYLQGPATAPTSSDVPATLEAAPPASPGAAAADEEIPF